MQDSFRTSYVRQAAPKKPSALASQTATTTSTVVAPAATGAWIMGRVERSRSVRIARIGAAFSKL